jgi:Ca2+-binding RTX toxin-like protein
MFIDTIRGFATEQDISDFFFSEALEVRATEEVDVIHGSAGRNEIFGGGMGDEIYGGDANDRLYGGGSDARLIGDGGDYLFGGAGRDELYGGLGADRLNGGHGHDQLYGQAGKDTFIFDGVLLADTLRDFKREEDTIELDSSAFLNIDLGQLDRSAFKWVHGIHQSPDAVDRDDRIIFDAQRNALFYDRDGSANRYDADKFAVVYDKVTADDFIIV